MKKTKRNVGSATVETVLVMPVILVVLVMVIYLIFDCINDSAVRADLYTELYSYSERGMSMPQKNADNPVDRTYVGEGENREIWGRDGQGIYVSVKGGKAHANGTYSYVSDSVTYKTEYKKCEDRLRRWQLYGDILWE